MYFAKRTAFLRLTTMAALGASAFLVADHARPERAFCPLVEACEAAAESLLGSIFGVPTALLGMAAFGGLYLMTLLPVEWARRWLKAAGFLAAAAGAGFIAFQAFVLRLFCPLCVVADGAGLLAGVATLTWPTPPIRLSGKRLHGETGARRAAWTLVAALVVVAPFAWPRPTEPAWVAIDPVAAADFEGAEGVEAVGKGADGEAASPTSIVTYAWPSAPAAAPAIAVEPAAAVSLSATPPTAPTPRPPPEAPARPTAPPTTEPIAQPSPDVPAPAPPPPSLYIVAYLNPYCGHCRATHRRLHDVLSAMGVRARQLRIYTWAGQDYPLWARACAYADVLGLEDRMFEELMSARSEHPSEVYAAAERAGIDVTSLRAALRDRTPPPRLLRDRQRVRAAGIKGLPTIDIGRRRLMGEQSASELREAIRAAL